MDIGLQWFYETENVDLKGKCLRLLETIKVSKYGSKYGSLNYNVL